MDFKRRKQLKDRAKYAYGLLNVLKCDIDILRMDTNNFNLDKLNESVADTDDTLRKLLLVIEEIEYILKLDKIERP